jgi:hypothetical protein
MTSIEERKNTRIQSKCIIITLQEMQKSSCNIGVLVTIQNIILV